MTKIDRFKHKDKRGRRSPTAPNIHLAKLAKKAQISPSAFSKILKGERKAGREFLFKISKATGMTVEQVWAWLEHVIKEGKIDAVSVPDALTIEAQKNSL